MQRIFFYGMIVLTVVLVLAALDFIVYRILRLCLSRHTANIANWVLMAMLTVTISITCWWGHTYTRLQLQVNRVAITSQRLPQAYDGYRIAQISDFHLDSFDHDEAKALIARMADSIRHEQPDIIVFTGDLVTIRAVEAYPYIQHLALLSQIPARDGQGLIPVYSILGNHDYADYAHDFTPQRRQQDIDTLVSFQQKAGWRVLRNESLLLQRPLHNMDQGSPCDTITLIGVENIGEPPFSVYGDLNLALESTGGTEANRDRFAILLSHNPTHWHREVLPDTNIDLMLCGHTHATQILIGSWSPAKWKYNEWMGLYSEGTQHLYVNTGIGSVGPRVRVGIKPEISILTLHAGSAE